MRNLKKHLNYFKDKDAIIAIDSHTAGDVTRLLIDGIPDIPGNTMSIKKDWLEKYGTKFRSLTMKEPRGFADMEGAILTEPVSQNTDIGVIFMSPKYFWDSEISLANGWPSTLALVLTIGPVFFRIS